MSTRGIRVCLLKKVVFWCLRSDFVVCTKKRYCNSMGESRGEDEDRREVLHDQWKLYIQRKAMFIYDATLYMEVTILSILDYFNFSKYLHKSSVRFNFQKKIVFSVFIVGRIFSCDKKIHNADFWFEIPSSAINKPWLHRCGFRGLRLVNSMWLQEKWCGLHMVFKKGKKFFLETS